MHFIECSRETTIQDGFVPLLNFADQAIDAEPGVWHMGDQSPACRGEIEPQLRLCDVFPMNVGETKTQSVSPNDETTIVPSVMFRLNCHGIAIGPHANRKTIACAAMIRKTIVNG